LRLSAGSTAVLFGPVLQRTDAVSSGTGAKVCEGGLAAGTNFDPHIVAGKLSFGGTPKLVSWAGYTAQAGETFNLFDWGQMAGSFDAIDANGVLLARL